MQGLARQLDRQLAAAAVGGVTNHGVVHVGAVDADLMGPPGIELEPQQGVVAESLHQGPVGAGVTAVFAAHHRVLLAIRRMTANRPDDRARVTGRHPMDDGEVFP